MRAPSLGLLAILLSSTASAEVVHVDASAAMPAVEEGGINQGTTLAPNGDDIRVNNRYLTMNDEPWLPVMAEMHYPRVPHDQWDTELAKLKASGIDIVATYVFWNYHEPRDGEFTFEGDMDLRRFIELADKNGLKVALRIGPWIYAEVRYGGLPNWIVEGLPLRSSDARYMAFVKRYWAQMAQQTKGLYWKDGGPIVMVQLENEYGETGPERGPGHIMDLKKLAIELGFDAPLYSLTAWPLREWPIGEVVLVSGGYADLPWSQKREKLEPIEPYAFRFGRRENGDLGANAPDHLGAAEKGRDNVPYFGAEFGGGLPTMYRRRLIVHPDDTAAMLPTAVGSGNNLYGYYMYHGGRNHTGPITTLEENTFVGGYNDTPIVEYDFQAPYGQYGEKGRSADSLRPFHYFLESYGSDLAPMDVRAPDEVAAVDDLETLRWGVRNTGGSGFVFVNNHVRQYPTPIHKNTQFSITLPGGNLTFPAAPVDIPTGAYFIWPFGLDLGGQRLEWASAQPFAHWDSNNGPVHVFYAIPGVEPEFAFPAGTKITGVRSTLLGDRVVARVKNPGTSSILTVSGDDGKQIRILVLTQDQARQSWLSDFGGSTRLILTNDEVVRTDQDHLSFISGDDPRFTFSAWPALPANMRGTLAVKSQGKDGMFTRYSAMAKPAPPMTVQINQVRQAPKAPPVRIGGLANAPSQPWPEVWGNTTAVWNVTLPPNALDGVDDTILAVDWVGDIARFYAGETLLDDRYYQGLQWRIGLRSLQDQLDKPLTFRISPWRGDLPCLCRG